MVNETVVQRGKPRNKLITLLMGFLLTLMLLPAASAAAAAATPDEAYGAEGDSYIYNVVYESASGVQLGTDTVTYDLGTTNRIEPKAFDGYTSPVAQDVVWDVAADGGKTVTFTYTPIAYDVTYDLDGGSASEELPATYTIEHALTVLASPVKDGYKFIGWTGANGDAPQNPATIPAGSTGDKSFTANWTPNTYTYNIVYLSSLGAQIGTATASNVFGTTNSVGPKTFEGYTSPAAQDVTWDVAADGGKTITFTYEPKTYNVTLNPDGGTVNGATVTSYTYSIGATLPLDVTKESDSRFDYTFAGWFDEDGNRVDTIPATSTGDKTYTARWLENSHIYYVTLNANGGTVNSGTVTFYVYGEGVTLPTDVTRTGFDFQGWFDSGGTKVTEITAEDTGDKAFRAEWTPHVYSVTLHTQGGEIVSGDVTGYTYGIGVQLPTNVVMLGYSFKGWFPLPEGGAEVSSISSSETGDKEFYAQWAPLTYSVKYETQGGIINSGKVDSYTYGAAVPLPTDVTKPADEKYTYSFEGWYTAELFGSKVTEIAADDLGDKTFYAKWTQAPRTYSVTLDPDGGIIRSGNVTEYTYGDTVFLPTNVVKDNFEFAGWFDEDGKEVAWISSTATGDKVYKAKWTSLSPDVYTITLPQGEGYLVEPVAGYDASAVAHGDDFKFTVKVDEGFILEQVLVGGAPIMPDEDGVFTIENVTADVTDLAVTIDKLPVSYEVSAAVRQLADVENGELAEFEVVLTGAPADVTATAWQWQFSETDAEPWYDSGRESAKSATFDVPANDTNKARFFRCVVTLSDGTEVESSSAQIKVKPVSEPATAAAKLVAPVEDGELAYFTVELSGGDADVTATAWQWQFSNDDSSWTNSSRDSAKSATFDVPANDTNKPRFFRCVVTLSDGTEVESSSAKIELVEFHVVTLPQGEGYTVVPAEGYDAAAVKHGDDFKFTVEVDDGYTLEQVSLDGVPLAVGADGIYTLEFVGEDIDGLAVTVASAPVPDDNPVATVTTEPTYLGKPAEFKVALSGQAEGITATAWQWAFSDDNAAGWTNSGATGNKTDTLTVTAAASSIDRLFRCTVTLSDGRKVVSEPLGFDITPVTGTIAVTTEAVPVGATAFFTATVDGLPEDASVSAWQWYFSNNGGYAWTASTGTGAATDQLQAPLKDDNQSRLFRCVATLSDGSMLHSDKIGFSISDEPIDPDAEVTATISTTEVEMGKQAEFTVEVAGLVDGLTATGYKWQYRLPGDVFGNWTDSAADGADKRVFRPLASADNKDRMFRCVVTLSDGRKVESNELGFTFVMIEYDYELTVATEPTFVGQKATFTATLTADGQPAEGASWQWYHSDDGWATEYASSAEGAKTSELTVNVNADTAAKRQFKCVTHAPSGESVTSEPIGFIIHKVSDYANAVVKTEPAYLGGPAVFTVETTDLPEGTSVATWQWRFSTNGGESWTDSTGEGAKTDTLSLTLSIGNKDRLYRCIVTYSDGTTDVTEGVPFEIIPVDDPTVTVSTDAVYLGRDATFKATVEGLVEGLSITGYQWSFSPDGGRTWTDSTGAGSKTDTLTVTASAEKMGYVYRCTITLSGGNKVESEPVPFEFREPVGTVNVTTENVHVGRTATFKATASDLEPGTTVESWFWLRSDDGGVSWEASSAAGNQTDTLSPTATEERRDRLFRAVAVLTDGGQIASEPIGFMIDVTATASTTEITFGEDGTFTVEMSNLPTGVTVDSYQWEYRLPGAVEAWYASGAVSAVTDALTLTSNVNNKERLYRCVVTLTNGAVIHSNAIGFDFIDIEHAYRVAVSTEPVPVGEKATFKAVFLDGDEPVEGTVDWQWVFSDDGWATSWASVGEGCKTDTLTVNAAADRVYTRTFKCEVHAPDGSTVVSEAIAFDAYTVADLATVTASTEPAHVGGQAVFKAEVTGVPEGASVTGWHWSFSEEGDVMWHDSTADGADTDTLTINLTADMVDRLYRCTVTFSDGSRKACDPIPFEIENIDPTVEVATEPVHLGQAAEFKATVGNLPDAVALGAESWQWYFSDDGGDTWTKSTAAGADTDTLTVSALAERAERMFRADVELTGGTVVKSEPVGFNLLEHPASVTVTTSEVQIGSKAVFEATAVDLPADVSVESWYWIFTDNGRGWSTSGADGAKTDTLMPNLTEGNRDRIFRAVAVLTGGVQLRSEAIGFQITEEPAPDPVAVASTEPVAVDETAAFTVRVDNLPAGVDVAAWQWYYSLDGAEPWYVSAAEGAKTDTVKPKAKAENAKREFRCVVMLSDGRELTSNAIGFDFGSPDHDPWVEVSTEPVALGSPAVFAATVRDMAEGVGVHSWKWYFSDDEWKTSNVSGAVGADTDTLKPNANPAFVYMRSFKCEVTLTDGMTITSEPVKFRLIDQEDYEAKAAAKLKAEVEDGALAEFTVELTGLPQGVEATAWQWQYLTPGDASWYNSGRASAKSATFDVPANATNKPREFRCVVTLSDGSKVESSSARIVLVGEGSGPDVPTPGPEPADPAAKAVLTAPVADGETAYFEVELTGLSADVTATAWQWQYLAPGDASWYNSGRASAKSATFDVPANATNKQREFRCVVTLSDGSKLTSEGAKIEIAAEGGEEPGTGGEGGDPVVPTPDPEPVVVTAAPKQAAPVADGETAYFEVELSGLGADVTATAWEWQYSYDDGASWTKSGRASATSATFDIPANDTNKGRLFRCVVTLSDGSKVESSSAKIEIAAEGGEEPGTGGEGGDPVVPTPDPEPVDPAAKAVLTAPVADGETAYFTVELTGLGADVTATAWEWQYSYDGGASWTKSGRASATSATFDVPANDTNKPREFRCVVTLSDGTKLTSEGAKIEIAA